MNDRQKAILYRAKHRGSKEADFLVGRFVEKTLENTDEPLLNQLEEFIEFSDQFLVELVNYEPSSLSEYQNVILQEYYKFWQKT